MTSAVSIRPALPSDREAIFEFTRDTFEWGDYIADEFDGWLDRDDTLVVVAIGDNERPIALATARMISPSEAWFHAARVHPDHRGRGIAAEISVALRAWAGEHGATVGRLLVEDWNTASIRHVEKTGRRRVATMVRCAKSVGDASPSPDGNGGSRVPSRLRSRPAHAAEAQPAFASWSVGELGRASRGLFAVGWTFRRLTIEDLVAAARRSAFWEIGAGWALASNAPDARFEVPWLETREEDAGDLLRSLVDSAIGSGSESIMIWLPNVDWAVRAAKRLGFETSVMHVYASAL
ncbi:MAG: GNAT family N-acetyltransferase [Actinomycetota bacterium]|nr:GNAT family N-acetyltransferase [Actinomycetota bacterium]